MAGRVYTGTSNLVAYGTTTTTPILAGSASSTAPFDIACVRVGIHTAGTAPTFPSNTSLLCQLSRTTGAIGGGSSIASTKVAPHNTTDVAATSGTCTTHRRRRSRVSRRESRSGRVSCRSLPARRSPSG